VCLEVNDATVLRNERHGSWNVAGGDPPIEHLANARQTVAGECASVPLASLGWNGRAGQHRHAETACQYRNDAPRVRLCHKEILFEVFRSFGPFGSFGSFGSFHTFESFRSFESFCGERPERAERRERSERISTARYSANGIVTTMRSAML
jgi:hypothetical protein